MHDQDFRCGLPALLPAHLYAFLEFGNTKSFPGIGGGLLSRMYWQEHFVPRTKKVRREKPSRFVIRAHASCLGRDYRAEIANGLLQEICLVQGYVFQFNAC